MYVHLGQETIVPESQIIGIFDLEKTSISKHTKDFLKIKTKKNEVINISYEMPKSFILCTENEKEKLYISQISTQTLGKRAKNSQID